MRSCHNMKVIILFFTIGIVGTIFAQEQGNITKIESFLYQRCKKHSTEASAYDEVKTHLTQFSEYLSYTASLLPNGAQQFCNDEKPRLITLMRELARDLKTCFPKEERYLPSFMYESFFEFLQFVCSEKTIENFFSTTGRECRNALKQQQAGQEVGHCFNKLFATFNSVVKKDDLCLDLKLAKTCFGEAIARYCPNFAGYEALNKKFFHAIRKPCNGAVNFGITSFLLMLTLITNKIF